VIVTAPARRWTRFAAVLSLSVLVAAPAQASYETFRRSMGNILWTPFDLILGPYVGMKSVVDNVQSVEDTTAVRVVYFAPGMVWNTGMQIGGASLRGIAGILELVPGIFLIPFEADMKPLFPLSDNQDAMVDIDWPPLYVKFGINYVD
jgi:hypothetical protein